MIGAKPVVHRRRWLSPVWLLPALASLLAAGFLYQQYQHAGQLIQIDFEQGNGILPGKTQLRYQGVAVGVVSELDLADDGRNIAVIVKIDKRARALIRKDAQFWLVSPKASLTEISGLDTLVSGNYINLLPGSEKAPEASHFVGLSLPPPGWQADGRVVHLLTDTLSGAANGAKLFYRGLEVGSVFNTQLTDEDSRVQLDLVIDNRYAHLLKKESRFWSVGGIRAGFGAGGVKLEVGNLATVLGGGIAFDAPSDSPAASREQRFELYPNLVEAERGERITLQAGELPVKEGMPILYEGLEIGRVLAPTLNGQGRILHALVAPEQKGRFTERSTLVLEGADISLSGVAHAERLLTGPVLRLMSLPGKPSDSISVVGQTPLDGPLLTLSAGDLSGITEGAPLWFKGMPVGRIERLLLDRSGQAQVRVKLSGEYQALLKGARFYKASPLQLEADLSGIRVDTTAASGWIGGGIKMMQVNGPRIDTLYPNHELATLATPGRTARSWTLNTAHADGVGVGTPLYYLGIEAGRVRALKGNAQGVSITVELDPPFAPLLGEHTRFWRLPAVDARLGGDGVKVKMGNLSTLLRGGIEFANLPGTRRSNHDLYASRDEATMTSRTVHLTSVSNPGLTTGTPIRYRGVTIGEITSIGLSPGLGRVELLARIDERYGDRFLRDGADYQLVQAKLGLTGAAHLDTLIKGAYVEASPGSGALSEHFSLLTTPAAGLKLLLTSPDLRGVSVGAPILFRKVAVGQVESVALARDGSRVETRITIAPEYAHLVRAKSRFWNVSGLKADVGLTGGTIEVETVQSLLAGGIAFNTPESGMGAKAAAGDRFTLYPEAEAQWLMWQPKIQP
ncbi:paraquat-inducible protein B [Aeromonas diversa CDC 2478-85]|uniref:Paraquat-inducible protein B n=1 Tax=Aeromonas diversa CDC 2478-85 TaxID=1268237 RepID=N9VL68_9GAMM|nr:MlaD family protein [Aeromonas diversa]ENY72086.1 paraquat-inducible protein B [Aeromonas diversa CDC 2478-85]